RNIRDNNLHEQEKYADYYRDGHYDLQRGRAGQKIPQKAMHIYFSPISSNAAGRPWSARASTALPVFGMLSTALAWTIMRAALENCGWHVVRVKMASVAGASLSDGTGSNTPMSPGTVMCLP